MNYLKNIKKRIKNYINPPKEVLPFFTKDIFKDKKHKIGEFTYGNPTVLFENDDANLHIGKFCSIADGVTIFLGGNHRTDWISTYPFNEITNYFKEGENIKGHPTTKGDVTIKNDVWIGNGVIIMSGVTIGNGAVIASGSLVSKDVGDYEVWGGNPSKLLKKRFDDQTIEGLLKMKWWDLEISEIKKIIPILCSNNFELLKNIDEKNT